ncbi:MAG: serpin family protein [Candidatus Pacebacteria bacterium]|nr:serpin family protein [Candidatus Paceibacterota bacterium]
MTDSISQEGLTNQAAEKLQLGEANGKFSASIGLPESSKKKRWGPLILAIFLLSGIGLGGIYFGISRSRSFREGAVPAPIFQLTPIPTSQPTRMPLMADSALSASHNVFGFNVLKELKSDDESKNVVISPLSIALALSMTYNGADGETRGAMAETLNIERFSVRETNEKSAALVADLENPDPRVKIAIANSIWGKKGQTFNSEFINTNKQYYQAAIEYLDFGLPEAVETINNWARENTQGKIPKIVEPPISPLMVMYLINAVYFKGSWTVEFDPELTEEKRFTLPDNSVISHPLMKQKRNDFNYFENDLFQAVCLSYGENERLRMYVFLPKRTLSEFVRALSVDNWNQWLADFNKTEGTILLPRFKIEYEKLLNKALSSLGMAIAFSPGDRFPKISPNLSISEVLHKVFIEVSEEGTEAAAVTSVSMRITAVNPDERIFYMEVNRPFFFAIQDNQTEEILFTGFIQEPL